jgi:hypothetical protein
MDINKRSQMIGTLEGLLLKEAAEDFVKSNNKKTLDIDNESNIQTEWYNFSLDSTRLWLSYMPDYKLEEILSKKIENIKNSGVSSTMFGKN